MSYVEKCALVAVLVAMLGCGRDAADAGQPPGQAAASATVPANLPIDALQARAETALRERRYYAPAGDSAIDLYLALRERTPDDAGVAAALTELQPYLLIAGEQALARGDLVETQRLLALLARVDTSAPALPRLRDGLRRAEQAQQQLALQALADQAVDTVAAAAEVTRLAEQARQRVADAPAVVAKSGAGNAVAAVPTPPPALRPPPPVVESTPLARAASASVGGAAVPPAPAGTRALPRLLNDSPPRYPLIALNRKIEGSVQIAFTIQPNGNVDALRLVSATPAGIFDKAALAAVARWRFEATGQPVETQRTLNFRLPKG